jgi:hypothetical protein
VYKCVEIKGEKKKKQQSCFISVSLKSWSGQKVLDPTLIYFPHNQFGPLQKKASRQYYNIKTAYFWDNDV